MRKTGKCFSSLLKIILLLPMNVTGYPTKRSDLDDRPDEQLLPNGTIVGKYAYTDKEGNPIQVKYYADDQSYGVELNRLKVVTSKSDMIPSTTTLDSLVLKDTKIEKPIKTAHTDSDQFDVFESVKYPTPTPQKQKISEPLDYFNKEAPKTHQKNKYKPPEYEVYMQNEINAPNKHCSSNIDKVRVYNFNKEARKVRQVTDDQKFCEQF